MLAFSGNWSAKTVYTRFCFKSMHHFNTNSLLTRHVIIHSLRFVVERATLTSKGPNASYFIHFDIYFKDERIYQYHSFHFKWLPWTFLPATDMTSNSFSSFTVNSVRLKPPLNNKWGTCSRICVASSISRPNVKKHLHRTNHPQNVSERIANTCTQLIYGGRHMQKY